MTNRFHGLFDPSTRSRYCCVFKSFHSGERFQKFAFSLKTIHRFSCERDMKTQGCGEIVNVGFEYCDVELCEMVGIGC